MDDPLDRLKDSNKKLRAEVVHLKNEISNLRKALPTEEEELILENHKEEKGKMWKLVVADITNNYKYKCPKCGCTETVPFPIHPMVEASCCANCGYR